MAFDEKAKSWYNKAIEYVRDKLAGKIRTEYGLIIGDDKQVVDWNEIEHTLDKLYMKMNSNNISVLEKRKEEVLSAYENDIPVSRINDYLNIDVSSTLISRKLFEWGVHDPFNLDEKKDQILHLKFEEAKTNEQIANEIGKSYDPSLITLAFSRWGVEKNIDSQVIRKNHQKKEIESLKQSVIDWYYKTGSIDKVSRVFHKPKKVLAEKLKEWGISNPGSGPGNEYWRDKYYSIPNSKREDTLGVHHERFYRGIIRDEDYSDISEDLDISMGTVKSGISRAKDKINQYLSNNEDE